MARQMAGPYYSGVTSLDPYEDLSFRGWFAANFHYSKLLQAVSSGEGVNAGNIAQFENDLAASMSERPDAITYIFPVREDARWHDIEPLNGRRVTTDDIWDSYRRFHQLSDRAEDWDRVVENASAIPQERTIRFDLREPYAPFLTLVGSSSHLWINPPEIVEDGTVASRPIGSGPWIFESYQPDELMSWRRNPAWHRSRDFVSGAGVFATGRIPRVGRTAATGLSACRPDAGKRERRYRSALVWTVRRNARLCRSRHSTIFQTS